MLQPLDRVSHMPQHGAQYLTCLLWIKFQEYSTSSLYEILQDNEIKIILTPKRFPVFHIPSSNILFLETKLLRLLLQTSKTAPSLQDHTQRITAEKLPTELSYLLLRLFSDV